jgi:subtilisin family serine protease
VECYQKNDFIHAIRYLVETAEKAGKPISIMIGIGTSQGAHDERGALSRYLSTIAGMSGVAVTIAAGNEGNTRHHYHGMVNEINKFDTVELIVGADNPGFTMEFWGKTAATFSIDITSPSGEYITRIPARLKETRIINFIFETTTIYVDYNIVEAQSGDQLILVRFDAPMEGTWRFRVYSSGNLSLDYHVWLPMSQFLGDDTYFINYDPYYTLTSPGNTFIPIVATAYDHRSRSLYINASRGYLRNDNIAPTVAAPGVNVIGPALNNGYITTSGTSVSAAHTAGIAAMFLEWGIVRGNLDHISTVEIKNLLIRGAKRLPNTIYPNKDWGYGIIDLYHAYLSLIGDITM